MIFFPIVVYLGSKTIFMLVKRVSKDLKPVILAKGIFQKRGAPDGMYPHWKIIPHSSLNP